MTEVEVRSPTHVQPTAQRKASNAGSAGDDMLAPLPSNAAGGGGGGVGGGHGGIGRRMSRAHVRGPGRGRLGTLAGPSLGLDPGAGQRVVLENSYRMRPDEAGRFNGRLARDILRAALEAAVASVGQRYDPAKCRAACQAAADQARRELRELESRRYKLVVQVHSMQLLGQAAVLASRSVGAPDTDSHAAAQVSGGDFVCVATAHALYYE